MWTIGISWVLLCFCLLSSIQTGVGGLHCFECEDLYKPYLCDFVTTCTDGQQCFVDEYITSSGNVLYKSGCRSTQRCSTTKRELEVRSEANGIIDDVASDEASDILFCSECCNNTEYCNKEGCQQSVPATEKMGPFCFDCRRQGKNACRRVTQCDKDEVCEISTEVINGLTLYNSRCANPLSSQICTGTSRDPVQLLVGKRDDTIVDACPKCCGRDFCNSDCNVTSSPVDGAWSEWSSWSDCSSTCGSGLISRTRTCSNPTPSNHGQGCTGDANQTQICTGASKCPVDGAWSEWSSWSDCSSTCGSGLTSRSRTCSNPTPSNHGHGCTGVAIKTKTCIGASTCPETGIWGTWTPWSNCHYTCGHASSKRFRFRHCVKEPCAGPHNQSKQCSNISCPVVDNVSQWSNWSTCSVSCGKNGIQLRTRHCLKSGGHGCSEKLSEGRSCDAPKSCSNHRVNGGWSEWGHWTPCIHGHCVRGFRQRSRACTNPIPKHGGHRCKGNHLQREICSGDRDKQCNNSGYSTWSTWSGCSATCGNRGITKRTRTCHTGQAGYGDCEGNSQEILPCNDVSCH